MLESINSRKVRKRLREALTRIKFKIVHSKHRNNTCSKNIKEAIHFGLKILFRMQDIIKFRDKIDTISTIKLKNNNFRKHFYQSNHRFVILTTVFLTAFGITFYIARVKSPTKPIEAMINNNYTAGLTVNGGGGSSNVNFTAEATPEGALAVAKQVLSVTTNSPNGAEVYVSSGTNYNLVKTGGSGQGTIKRTTANFSSPATLVMNTWGYALPSDSSGNAVNVAGFNSTSAYDHLVESTKTGVNIGSGPTTLRFAGLKESRGMEKIYDGRSQNFPVYIGVLVGGNVPAGNYETNIYYTVTVEASDNVGGEIVVNPQAVSLDGEDITVTSSFKPGKNNGNDGFGVDNTISAGDIRVTVDGEECRNLTILSGVGENLKVNCRAPRKAAGKYNVIMEIAKVRKSYTKVQGLEYKTATPMETLTSMQDPTLVEKCKNSPEHTVVRLKDLRDNNYYNVVRAKDGKCWMAQNLRFNLTSGVALTPETSDVTSNWTPNHTTQTGSSIPSWPTSTTGYNNPRSHDTGNTEYGVYYNWNAATAGSGNSTTNTQGQNVPDSVCPKGWKLPRIDKDGNQNINDYEKLTVSYGGNDYTGNSSLGSSGLRSAPLSFPLSGYYGSDGKIYSRGSHGYFWSSTVYDSHRGFLMALNSSNVTPRSWNVRSSGWSVRCVVRTAENITPTGDSMQDMTAEMCYAMPEHTVKTLIDKRDGESYKITKAKDGRCWMAQNLRLKLSPNKTLTPADSDVSDNWTPEHETGTGNQGPTFSNDYYKEYSHYFGTKKYGVYYTWRAATAGEGDQGVTAQGESVSDSICPKGWKLPKGGQISDLSNDFYTLMTKYGTGEHGSNQLRSAPLSFTFSGVYNPSDGQLRQAASTGHYWSSTSRSASSTYAFRISQDTVASNDSMNRHAGAPIRCMIPGNKKISDATYMQDVTREMCSNTPEHTVKTLIDKRDNKSYKVVKAKDGKCWMAENLNLRLSSAKTLTPADSDVSSSWTPSHNTGTGNQGPNFANNYNQEYSHYFGTEQYGVHYTWNAATAGKGESFAGSTGGFIVGDSICPKGWKLPRSETVDGSRDFYDLAMKYGGTGSGGSNQLQKPPLSFILAGRYYPIDGKLIDAGSEGYYWTSVMYNQYNAYNLLLRPDFVAYNNNEYRYYGNTIRCVVY